VKRVGVFGGSFDPVHTGHVEAVNSFLNSGLIDEVWILLTPNPPHKTDQKQAGFSHRLKMLQLVFSGYDKVKISDLEKDLPTPSYTLQTIRHLKKEYPGNLFFLCIGEDSLESFHKWYKYNEILDECTLLVVNRPGFDHSRVDSKILENTIFIDHKPLDISSTQIREGERENYSIPDSVRRYMQDHNLYQTD
jgi:nicotinate-nucleotide adenylyltransferase